VGSTPPAEALCPAGAFGTHPEEERPQMTESGGRQDTVYARMCVRAFVFESAWVPRAGDHSNTSLHICIN
jgi:hypothetical protein